MSFLSDSRASLRSRFYEDFWDFCSRQCRGFRVGCARSCELRKRLGIPPHGKSYFGKLKGEIRLGLHEANRTNSKRELIRRLTHIQHLAKQKNYAEIERLLQQGYV